MSFFLSSKLSQNCSSPSQIFYKLGFHLSFLCSLVSGPSFTHTLRKLSDSCWLSYWCLTKLVSNRDGHITLTQKKEKKVEIRMKRNIYAISGFLHVFLRGSLSNLGVLYSFIFFIKYSLMLSIFDIYSDICQAQGTLFYGDQEFPLSQTAKLDEIILVWFCIIELNILLRHDLWILRPCFLHSYVSK